MQIAFAFSSDAWISRLGMRACALEGDSIKQNPDSERMDQHWLTQRCLAALNTSLKKEVVT